MSSWKHYFEKINEEYEITVKKKQALNSLVNSGRISQSTFELFNKEMDEAMAEIERRKRNLLEKMNVKIEELKEQAKILERLLANFEIQHVSGEIEEEAYQREIALTSMGLETTRQELDVIKEIVNKLNAPQTLEGIAVHEEAKTKSPESVDASSLEVVKVEAQTENQELSENSQETQTLVETKVEEVSKDS